MRILRFFEKLLTKIVSLFFKQQFDREKYHFNFSEVWFSPWDKDERFNLIYDQIRNNTLLSKRKLFDLYLIGIQQDKLKANFLEIGTLRGGSAAMLLSSFSGEKLLLWDNWKGGGANISKDDYFLSKEYSIAADLQETQNLLSMLYPEFIDQYSFINDIFPNNIKLNHAFNHLSLVHFDIYDSHSFIIGIDLLWTKLMHGGIFIVSAYGSISLNSLTDAVNNVVKSKPDCFFVQSQSGMGLMIKR